ncbi:MAG TPA: DinB family protein [Candidatus Acidoferrales bacterium]|nr:DinB family protein [Candidatus Acidoferrales bacterium]
MKRFLLCAIVAACMPLAVSAQSSSNPVSDTVKKIVAQRAKILTAAAEEMPADKYNFQPTPKQMTFAHLIMHLQGSNFGLCSAISGTKPAERPTVSDTDGKDKLVAALKSSFDFCNDALAKIDDSKLGESVPFFRGSQPRAAVMIALTNDLFDHYSQAAMYLRLNGLLPPTAQGRQSM